MSHGSQSCSESSYTVCSKGEARRKRYKTHPSRPILLPQDLPTIWCSRLFLGLGRVCGAPNDVTAVGMGAHKLCAIAVPT